MEFVHFINNPTSTIISSNDSNAGSWGVLTSALCISSIQGYFPCFLLIPRYVQVEVIWQPGFFTPFGWERQQDWYPVLLTCPEGFFWKCPSGRAFDQFKSMSVWKNRCGLALESGVHGISKNGNSNETWTTNRWSRGFPIPNKPIYNIFPVF